MSIIANFINNIQDLTFSNVILSLNNQINSLDETSRSAFDVYCCKNKNCPYRIKAKNEIIKEHGKLNPRDKISYIYRDIKISLNSLILVKLLYLKTILSLEILTLKYSLK